MTMFTGDLNVTWSNFLRSKIAPVEQTLIMESLTHIVQCSALKVFHLHIFNFKIETIIK